MHWCAYDVSAPAGLFRLAMVFAKRTLAYVCVHVTDSRTRTKSKFSHSVTSFRSKLLHTSQRLSTGQIFLLSFSLKPRNIASAIIKRRFCRRNALLTRRWLEEETYVPEISSIFARTFVAYGRFLSRSRVPDGWNSTRKQKLTKCRASTVVSPSLAWISYVTPSDQIFLRAVIESRNFSKMPLPH